ncbi:MAG: hypothetical protein JJU37_11785 [Balneolaceae bacterium]|nr:hypothetical protein [Balneolaceae bacterium]
MNKIGIRHEDKYNLERRTPLVPNDIADLIKGGVELSVERSDKRVFRNDEFEKAGAILTDHLDHCDVIMGVKEMPEDYFEAGKTYVFFSHVIKGQPYNMPMLKNLMKSGSTLIDYEKITDEKGRRLIFFGRYAGLAGMINTLWTVGQRYQKLGVGNPFSQLKQAYTYNSLDEARSEIIDIAKSIKTNGLPDVMKPLIIAITGDGNVSQGALEIAKLLDADSFTAKELKNGDHNSDSPLIIVNILPQDYLSHKEGLQFDLNDYIKNPEKYESSIEELLPNINVFVNGIYWDDRYPKLIKKDWLMERVKSNSLNLKVIGDITCDVHGSVECSEKATEIEDPVFIYDPTSDKYRMGFNGEGVAVMAVDILPSELPRESSEHFSSSLKPFISSLASADFSVSFDELNLAEELKRAIIVYKGSLTDQYAYLDEYL